MHNSQRLKAVRRFFALEHNIVVLLGALLAIGMGEELWTRFMPKYLEALGAGAVAIGAYGSFKRVVDTIYQYPGGWLADRMGRKRALVLFNLIAATGYLVYLLTERWEIVVLGTLLVLAWSSMSQPAIFALIGDTLSRSQRAMGFSVQSIWKRIPIVIAPPVGGYLLARLGLVPGMRVGFAVSLVFALAAIYLQSHFYHTTPPNREAQSANMKSIWQVMPTPLRRLLLTDCLVRFGSNMAAVYVVLLVINVHRKSPLEFGAFTSLQMLTAIAGYLPAAHLADRFGRQPFILATFTFFTLFPLSLVVLPSHWLFVAFLIAGLREIGEPARKARIVDLAEESHRGRVIGLYYLIRGLATIPAPFLGGLLWQHSFTWPFLLGGAASGIGLILYAINPQMPAAAWK
ncbi:MAG TPA: MFS transporter [Anaerolineae bacterium]|nr:MFS transporter [Anaerolineae bacterium]HIQ04629.1 MFS transporter [Anaerolineae bacterium]